MNFRHEWKHPLNSMDLQETRSRLRCVMRPDPHAGASGKYEVRSLYFDSPGDSALREKLDGISRREKFRMRRSEEHTSEPSHNPESRVE